MQQRSKIHVERLFATPFMLDKPAIGCTVPSPLLAAASATDGVALHTGVPVWDDGRVDGQAPWLLPLVSHIRDLAERHTANLRAVDRVRWHIGASLYCHSSAAQPAFPARYDAFWTALYVLDDGYGLQPSQAAGGEFVFFDPRLPAPMMETPSLRLLSEPGKDASAYTPELSLCPASGQLFFFPAWLRVEQRARHGARPRRLIVATLVADIETIAG